MPSPSRGYYVTGTDTGVGKTVASVALLHALQRDGLRANGMKPVASGCISTTAGLRNDDALALIAASTAPVPYVLHNPVALPDATAPQLAAARAGVVVKLPVIVAAYRQLALGVDAVVVEGVGGWLAPLADGLEQATLAAALRLQVVLVVGVRLGCLNHARLSARAIEQDGLVLSGWIGSVCEPAFADADDYRALLDAALSAPCLGWLPWSTDPSSGTVRTPTAPVY